MLIITALLILLGLRTLGFHLQQWQIREYRWDRLRDHLFTTKEGQQKLWNIWFFGGVFPRPRISGRLLTIGLIWTTLVAILLWTFRVEVLSSPLIATLIWERTIWLTVAIAIGLSNIPSTYLKKRLFQKAQNVIRFYDQENKKNPIIRIGITGSYGKSSTKEILTHLLIQQYGAENVLYNPRNENNEVAIARLILRSKQFFTHSTQKQRFLVIEMGAYKKGEIQKICDFIRPHYSIITGVNNQHISLFGSQRTIQEAKFELAEATQKTVFFNADSPLLNAIANEKNSEATLIPIARTTAHKINAHIDRTDFELFGIPMTLPWMGEFFVSNALLCLELCRELGIPPKKLAHHLSTLPPLKRALSLSKFPNGATLINDPYSANPDGVLKALDELKKFPKGRRVFIGIPLIELGDEARYVHEQIFKKLKDLEADVFWLKKDYTILGKKICGSLFYGKDLKTLRTILTHLKKHDVILVESRLPKNIQKFLNTLRTPKP